ncbi:MAG: hypothetical protein K0U59_03265 [Gammaproteobacteria bacterium]|nr:hypothetical protein [Gammaproteobacteria bacterium]
MMRLSYLKTHWTPEEAYAYLSFLDDVRDTLWQTYGSDIMEHYHQQPVQDQPQTEQLLVDSDEDNIPF